MQDRVRAFAQHQKDSLADFEVELSPGVHLGQRNIPVAAAGAYVPGGRYPLVASAHMTVVTAKVAGVERVTACTPPIRGEIPAATVAALHLAGADEIFLLGGTQAVAAMAIGTETIGKVDLLDRTGQRVRGRGQAAALRRGRHRPVRRPDRDPDRGRRRGRPVRGGRRPAQPGRARAGLARGADHHQRGPGPAGDRAGGARSWSTCRPPTSPARPGETTARSRWSRPSTRRTRSPTDTPPSTSRS